MADLQSTIPLLHTQLERQRLVAKFDKKLENELLHSIGYAVHGIGQDIIEKRKASIFDDDVSKDLKERNAMIISSAGHYISKFGKLHYSMYPNVVDLITVLLASKVLTNAANQHSEIIEKILGCDNLENAIERTLKEFQNASPLKMNFIQSFRISLHLIHLKGC